MFNRPLVSSAVLFAVGILASIFDINIWCVTLFLAAAVIAIYTITRRRLFLCILMTLIVFLGFVRMEWAEKNCEEVLSKYVGQKRNMELVVTEFSDEKYVIGQFCDDNKKYNVNLYVGKEKKLSPGDIIQGEINLRRPARMKATRSDYAAYLLSRGIYLSGSSESVEIAGRVRGGIAGRIYSLRRHMDSIGKTHLSAESRMLYNAMVFGDKSLISAKLSNALQAAGLNHIAVVSGMHLTVIIAVQMFFMERIFGKRRIGNVMAIIGALFVTFITGAGASVVRALIMCCVYQISRILYRENDALTSCAASAFIMLFINPYTVFNAGFILSLLSVLGIILYNKKLTHAFSFVLPSWAATTMGVSLSAQLLVTVAVIVYFGIITPYAILSNLLVAFIVTPFTLIGMATPLFEKMGFIADILFYAMDFMSDIIESVCYAVESFPGAILTARGVSLSFVLLWLLLLVLVYIYPSSSRKYLRTAAAFLAVSFIALLTGQSSVMDMRFLRYGGATMTAIAFDSGDALLIDCADYIDATELEKNTDKVFRYGILSSDTLGQMHKLKEAGNMEALIIHRDMFTEKLQKALKDESFSKKLRIILLKDGQELCLGGARISFLRSDAAEKSFVKVNYGQKSVVSLQSFTSNDIENMVNAGENLHCDVLYVPFGALHKYTDTSVLCDGKIIESEKSYSINNKFVLQ